MFVVRHKISNRFLFGNSSFSELKNARIFNSQEDAEFFLEGISTTKHPFEVLPLCKNCKSVMKEGIALKNQVVVFADFVNDEPLAHHGATCAPVGDAVMCAVWKCPNCGHSFA